MTAGFGSPAALREFVDETRARLRALRPLRFLAGGGDRVDAAALHAIFREVHSLKAAANLLGLTPIEQLCHRFEDVLAGYRDGELAPAPESERELEPTLAAIGRLADNVRIVRALDVSPELARLGLVLESRRRRG